MDDSVVQVQPSARRLERGCACGRPPQPRDPGRRVHLEGGHALWELTNFGQLFWEGPEKWVLPLGEQWFSKRIWVEVDPHGGHAAVLEAREEALQSLDEIPGSELPANEAAKAAHAARIKADLDLLEELVARRGSIGATVLPDALRPIIECHAVHQDGNDRSATFATADYCFCIRMSTS